MKKIILPVIAILLLIGNILQFVQISNKNSENEKLTRLNYDYISSYQDKLSDLNTSLTSSNQENTDLKTQLDTLQSKLDEESQKNKELNESNTLLNEKNNLLLNENKTLKASQKDANTYIESNTTSNSESVNNQANGKTVYLTFDDGPSENTDKILDILKEENIKATFFIIGHTGQKTEERMKRIVNEGHSIGNHTNSHDYSSIYASVTNFEKDFLKLNDYIKKVTGVETKIMRFPGGSNNHVSWKYGGKGIMQELVNKMTAEGYVPFDWNVSSTDAEKMTQSKDNIINSVLKEISTKHDNIILFHDSSVKTTTVQALPTIIHELKNRGYQFASLDEHSYKVQFTKAQ